MSVTTPKVCTCPDRWCVPGAPMYVPGFCGHGYVMCSLCESPCPFARGSEANAVVKSRRSGFIVDNQGVRPDDNDGVYCQTDAPKDPIGWKLACGRRPHIPAYVYELSVALAAARLHVQRYRRHPVHVTPTYGESA